MSTINKTYLDLNGLTQYDEKIKEYIPITHGYYNNGNFYSDSSLTTLITGEAKRLYIDLRNNGLYEYINGTYVMFGGGAGTNVQVSATQPTGQVAGDIWIKLSGSGGNS